MRKSVGQTALECLLDLGITIVYAGLVGLAIVAIVASDNGPASIWTAALYASLLPASVVLLILIDLGVRLLSEARVSRRRSASTLARNT